MDLGVLSLGMKARPMLEALIHQDIANKQTPQRIQFIPSKDGKQLLLLAPITCCACRTMLSTQIIHNPKCHDRSIDITTL